MSVPQNLNVSNVYMSREHKKRIHASRQRFAPSSRRRSVRNDSSRSCLMCVRLEEEEEEEIEEEEVR